jgi:hypothetical protein
MNKMNFEFNIGNGYIYYINEKIILHITCVNNSVSCLYFTDELNKKINIPDGIIVKTFNYENNEESILKNIKNIHYALCYSDDYVVEYNNNKILNIKNKRSWEINF